MRVLEKQIEKPVVAWAKKNGIKVKKKVYGEQLDRWFFLTDGNLYIQEYKAPGKKLTPLQEQEINELKQLGYDVGVFDDAKEAISELERRATGHYEVDTSPIPKRFCTLAVRARSGRAIRRPRNGQNIDNLGGAEDS